MNCKKCNNPAGKAGTAWSGTRKVQKYKCSKCGYAWAETTEPINRDKGKNNE